MTNSKENRIRKAIASLPSLEVNTPENLLGYVWKFTLLDDEDEFFGTVLISTEKADENDAVTQLFNAYKPRIDEAASIECELFRKVLVDHVVESQRVE